MTFSKRILCLIMALTFVAMPAFSLDPQATTKPAPASSAKKTSASTKPAKDHVTQGSVVALSNDTLTIRGSNKKDMVLMINSATQKPASLVAGNKITVHYKDEANKHVATDIQAVK